MKKLPQLNIQTCDIHSVTLEAREDFDQTKELVCQVEVGFRVKRHPEILREFAIFFSTRLHTDGLDAANLSYDLSLRVLGVFTSASALGEGAIDQSIVTNALTMLYGVCRGYVAQITGVGVHGKLILPAVTFDEVVNTEQEETQRK